MEKKTVPSVPKSSRNILPVRADMMFLRLAFPLAFLCLIVLVGVIGGSVRAQDEIDTGEEDEIPVLSRAEREKRVAASLAAMTVRARVTKAVPQLDKVLILWRAGGEGLGGNVRRGEFAAADGGKAIAVGEWSAWLPLLGMIGKSRSWEFPSISARRAEAKKGEPVWLSEMAVELEFAASGKPFKQISEAAPDGATVGFAFPSFLLAQNEPSEAAFRDELRGLSGHAQARRERLAKRFSAQDALPKQFALLGRLDGYGEGVGYGIRHNNRAIVRDEALSLELLGVNGLVGRESVELAHKAGQKAALQRMYWGGPGATTPMTLFRDLRRTQPDVVSDPYDPRLREYIKLRVETALVDIGEVGARETWTMWGDEIGPVLSSQMGDSELIQQEYRKYLQGLGIKPAEVGVANWDSLRTFPLWTTDAKGKRQLSAAPTTGPAALNYYYTYRFMSKATADVYGQGAKMFEGAGLPMFSMMTPSPSWTGATLDWHEFYDGKANTAIVWETSNRDPRSWQWESYLADIARGIKERHGLKMGVLVKPHRGAVAQRALSSIARGATAIRWYTYGPDYAKGDSFSERPELLEAVAGAGRFLAKGEEYLYGARRDGEAQVALVSPRSSEIWGRAADPDNNTRNVAGRDAAFEDTKWIYLALSHAHIPVDVLSEEQLAEGKLSQYKVLYVTGPNLHRKAAAQVKKWVSEGGLLWTNALGLSLDEAKQPLTVMHEVLGLGERKMETWGVAPITASTGIKGLEEKEVPPHSAIKLHGGAALSLPGAAESETLRAYVAREVMEPKSGGVLASYADGKPAVTRHEFGKGAAIVAGFWPGIAYSNGVRKAGFDLRTDYSASLRALISGPAIARGVYRPVVPEAATVEAVLLEKDRKRSIALMNWTFAGQRDAVTLENLRIGLPGLSNIKTVRSLRQGVLPLQGTGDNRFVVLPRLEEVDLLIAE